MLKLNLRKIKIRASNGSYFLYTIFIPFNLIKSFKPNCHNAYLISSIILNTISSLSIKENRQKYVIEKKYARY